MKQAFLEFCYVFHFPHSQKSEKEKNVKRRIYTCLCMRGVSVFKPNPSKSNVLREGDEKLTDETPYLKC